MPLHDSASRKLAGAAPVAALVLWVLGTTAWWALAFPPSFAASSELVQQAQAVCFGTQANGMPAPYGWGALVAAPLSMLGVLLVGWGRELGAALRRLRGRPTGLALAAALATTMAAEASWVGWHVVQAMQPRQPFTLKLPEHDLPADMPRLDKAAPTFALTNHEGREVSLDDFRGEVVYVTFIFGNCQTVCPATIKHVEAAAQRSDVKPAVLAISLDAWRDTPGTLAGIKQRWEMRPQTQVLSGRIDEVNRVVDAFNVARTRDPDTGEIDHTALVYVVDPQGRIAYALLQPKPDWLAEAARRIAGEGAGGKPAS